MFRIKDRLCQRVLSLSKTINTGIRKIVWKFLIWGLLFEGGVFSRGGGYYSGGYGTIKLGCRLDYNSVRNII